MPVRIDCNFFNFQYILQFSQLRTAFFRPCLSSTLRETKENKKQKKKGQKEEKKEEKMWMERAPYSPAARRAVGKQITGWSSRYEIRLLRFGVRVASVSSSGQSFQRIGLSGRAVAFLVQASRSTGRRISNTDGIIKRVAHPSREKVLCAPRRKRVAKDREERRRETRLSRSREG